VHLLNRLSQIYKWSNLLVMYSYHSKYWSR